MNFTPTSKLNMVISILVISTLLACSSSLETHDNAEAENPEGGSGTPAMVDSVTVEQRDNHYYAIIDGFYPDPCTHISSVQQVVVVS